MNKKFDFFLIILTLFMFIFNNTLYIEVQSTNYQNTTTQRSSNQPESWSQDVRVSEENNDYWCVFPSIAINEQYVHILWDSNLNSSKEGKGLCYRRSTDNGNTWDDITYMTYPYDSVTNDIAVWSSNVHTVFTSHIPNTTGIKYRKSIDNGKTWESINSNLTDLGGTELDIEVYKNNIHIVYKYNWQEVYGIIYLRSLDNGITWDEHRWLLKGYGDTFRIWLDFDIFQENLYIVYWGVNDTVELLKSHDNGDTWEHRILFNGPWVGDPGIACNDNHVGIVWINKSVPNSPLEFIKSDDYGNTWTIAMKINDPDPAIGVFEPSIIMLNQTYHLVWSDYRDSTRGSRKVFTEIYYKKSINAGINWTNDIRLTKTEKNSNQPTIGSDNNNVYVIWNDERVDGQQIFFKRTLPDFIIYNLTLLSPEPSWANSSVQMELSLKNIGYADGYFVNVTVNYLYEPIFHRQINKIKLGEIGNILFNWTPIKSGLNQLEIMIDQQQMNQEWDETNNIFSKDFFIQENSAPVAELGVNKTKAEVFDNINLDASASYDPDGSIMTYYFDYGDGNNSGWIDTPTIVYNYSQAGTYKCIVKVRDDRGAENQNIALHDLEIKWWPMAPVIRDIIFYPENPKCNENVSITVDAFDLNFDTLEYIYTTENGMISGTGEEISWHAPNFPGSYMINIQVFDGVFYSSNWILNISIIENQNPIIEVINVSTNWVQPGELVNFTIVAIDPDDQVIQIHYYADGGEIIENGSSFSWLSPGENGIFKIIVNVSDRHDGFIESETFIIVGEPSPDIVIKSLKAYPDRIYKGETTDVLFELEINKNYINFIKQVYVNLSELIGTNDDKLYDSRINGDENKADGIYSNKFSICIKNYTGDYQLWTEIESIIPGYSLTTFTIIKIENKPSDNSDVNFELYLGMTIVLILIFILMVIILVKRKRGKSKKG